MLHPPFHNIMRQQKLEKIDAVSVDNIPWVVVIINDRAIENYIIDKYSKHEDYYFQHNGMRVVVDIKEKIYLELVLRFM